MPGVNQMPPKTPYTPPNEMPPAPIHRVLPGQKALVTGASKGLGQAMAIGFAQAGADVMWNYNSDAAGALYTKEMIENAGARAVLITSDVSPGNAHLYMLHCNTKSIRPL